MPLCMALNCALTTRAACDQKIREWNRSGLVQHDNLQYNYLRIESTTNWSGALALTEKKWQHSNQKKQIFPRKKYIAPVKTFRKSDALVYSELTLLGFRRLLKTHLFCWGQRQGQILSINLNPEVHFRLYGRHLEKSIWHYNSADDRPITTKFDRQMQNDMPMTMHRSKSKPAIEFQYGGRPFSKTRCSFISAIFCRNLVCNSGFLDRCD